MHYTDNDGNDEALLGCEPCDVCPNKSTHGGDRTHNLLLRKQTPYPLGYTGYGYIRSVESGVSKTRSVSGPRGGGEVLLFKGVSLQFVTLCQSSIGSKKVAKKVSWGPGVSCVTSRQGGLPKPRDLSRPTGEDHRLRADPTVPERGHLGGRRASVSTAVHECIFPCLAGASVMLGSGRTHQSSAKEVKQHG